jgi:hypothetical protein
VNYTSLGVSRNGDKNGWFIRESATKMDDNWGYPPILGNPNFWLLDEKGIIFLGTKRPKSWLSRSQVMTSPF